MSNIVQGFKIVDSAGLPCSTKLTKKREAYGRHKKGFRHCRSFCKSWVCSPGCIPAPKNSNEGSTASKRKEGACAIWMTSWWIKADVASWCSDVIADSKQGQFRYYAEVGYSMISAFAKEPFVFNILSYVSALLGYKKLLFVVATRHLTR